MKCFRRIISIILVIAIGIGTPSNVLAAGPKYVSDVMVYEAGSFGEAKNGLADLGYEIVENSNLNATLSTGVYLGYKTTDDPDEALTDIAAMNMLGDYSYGDYQELMKKYHNIIYDTVRNFETAIAEFQTNFANGAPEAQMAYDSVNIYRDDDSRKLMGDYLLDYDFSEDGQEKLTDTLMQANSDIVMSIMQTISMAVDTEETTMLERLSESGPDELLERYTGVYPSVAKAQRALESDYSAAADILRAWWTDFYEYLCKVETDYFEKDADGSFVPKEDALEEVITAPDPGADLTQEERENLQGIYDLTDTALYDQKIEDISLFILLDGMPYGDGTLLDLFKRPVNEIEMRELYPIADAMSAAQRAQLELLGIRATILGASIDLDENAEETQEAIDDNAAEKAVLEPVSIFTGVDRSLFGEGTAVTGRAEQHEQLTGESFLSKYTGIQLTGKQIRTGIVYSTAAVLGTGAMGIIATVIQSRRQAPYAEDFRWAKKVFEKTKETYENGVKLGLCDPNIEAVDLEGSFTYSASDPEEIYVAAKSRYENVSQIYHSAGRTAKIMKCVSFALLAIAIVIDVYFVVSFFTMKEPEEAKIPHYLVSIADTEYGEDYICYETVKNQDGEAADVNHHEGDRSIGWLVLYQTHEIGAGDPILAKDLRVQTGSGSVEEDGAFVHLFDHSGAVNLTDPKYTGKNDSVNGTYVLFSRETSVYTGSAISGGITVLYAASGLIVGLFGGMLLSGLRKKKIQAAES